MACRTNLKKDKRVRNRTNAFRFKKGGFVKRRFNGPDFAAQQKKIDEDNQFTSLVRRRAAPRRAPKGAAPGCQLSTRLPVRAQIFTYTAEAEAAAAEEAKAAEKEEAKAASK